MIIRTAVSVALGNEKRKGCQSKETEKNYQKTILAGESTEEEGKKNCFMIVHTISLRKRKGMICICKGTNLLNCDHHGNNLNGLQWGHWLNKLWSTLLRYSLWLLVGTSLHEICE